jgi:hypothetical protein
VLFRSPDCSAPAPLPVPYVDEGYGPGAELAPSNQGYANSYGNPAMGVYGTIIPGINYRVDQSQPPVMASVGARPTGYHFMETDRSYPSAEEDRYRTHDAEFARWYGPVNEAKEKAMKNSQTYRWRTRIEGTVQDVRSVPIDGDSQPHTVVKLQTRRFGVVVADLGSGASATRGARVAVDGRMGWINGRRVFISETVGSMR